MRPVRVQVCGAGFVSMPQVESSDTKTPKGDHAGETQGPPWDLEEINEDLVKHVSTLMID